MDQQASRAGWDMFLFGVPLIAFLIFGFFRLDQAFTSKKKPGAPHAKKPKGERSMQCDPDGRPWDDS